MSALRKYWQADVEGGVIAIAEKLTTSNDEENPIVLFAHGFAVEGPHVDCDDGDAGHVTVRLELPPRVARAVAAALTGQRTETPR